ncbi:formate dehydrogenase accessory protein FdhE [Zophobihabitans entericus]|uniref:Protein FdhE homolog n=1 Tax=Zophobihabitans entericus TaxID=1635327 RepID=A0A6G9IDI9_9GAMM|nr:formate dehydrogenase accessory protein FdhE [Zophobihabitans entericus]QIQ22296.1 formate dehydrogenase accessory protein FdhE [Zophobihabitans entericus]
MTIRIVPQEQLEQHDETKTSVVGHTPLLFYPSPKTLYHHRLKRLTELAKDNPFSEYLKFCAQLVAKQEQLLKEYPIQKDLADVVKQGAEKNLAPLSLDNYSLTDEWEIYLKPLCQALKGYNPEIDKTIEVLESETKSSLQEQAISLIKGELSHIDSNKAIFIWTALSLYYSQLASQLPGKAKVDIVEQRQYCPVCRAAPIASVIHLGQNVGLRYLHCSLCETEWNVTRVICTNCEDTSALDYYSLDKELSSVKAECCESCNSYLKVFYQDLDPHLEVIADDLATLILDIKTEEEGFTKTGQNPFLFAKQ